MRTRNALIISLLFVTVIATFAALASASDGESVDDKALAANVKSALQADDSLTAFNISIEARDGVVTLSGWVSSQGDVVRAGQIAQDVKGVQSVRNNLAVK